MLANLRFVVSVTRQYEDFGLSLVELNSEGNFGLMEAVKHFDETRGSNSSPTPSGGSARRF